MQVTDFAPIGQKCWGRDRKMVLLFQLKQPLELEEQLIEQQADDDLLMTALMNEGDETL